MRERLDALGRRWSWLGTVLEVQQRFSDVRGGSIASDITMVSFVSLFPLLLVAIAVLGFISRGGSDVASSVIDHLGLTGQAADTVDDAVHSARQHASAASAIGLVGVAWSGLGLVSAVQRGVSVPWQATRPGWKTRLLGVPWLIGATLLFTASFALSALLGFLPGFLAPVNVVVSLAIDFGLFLWTFWILGAVRVGVRPLVPGAIVATIGFEVLKVVGSVYVPRAVARASALYGSLGIVFAVLAWLLFFGRLLVYSSVLNVVRYERAVGTVSLEINAPRFPGTVPLETTRAGVVVERDAAPPGGE